MRKFEKFGRVWLKSKKKKRDYYNQLAGMVDEMTPNDIYATVQVTPRPGTTLPQCAEDLLEELGNEETFRRILAVGYMAWEKFEKNRTKKAEVPYKPSTIRDVAKKFLTTTSRIRDIQRGEAMTREQTRLNKMIKAEKKKEKEKVTERSTKESSSEEKGKEVISHRNGIHTASSCRVKNTSAPQKLGPFGTTKISQGKHL